VSLAAELATMREAWAGRSGRNPDAEWFASAPAWARNDAGYAGLHAKALWTCGIVDWGFVVLANAPAWHPGGDEVAGMVLFSDDATLRREPEAFRVVSDAIWALRHGAPIPTGMRTLAAWARPNRWPSRVGRVPFELTDGRVVWYGGLVAHRRSLPGARLRDNLVPIVRPPKHEVDAIHLAPVFAWAPTLVARWLANKEDRLDP
jgi:hypothetical protein